jgi:predicted N-acetyltransferase YhbS
MEIRPLRHSDDRARFCSGDADLDRYLHRYAGQNQFLHHVGATYVAIQDDRVVGYATVSPGAIAIDDLPEPSRRRLPKYPLPVLRLARLAVDQSFKGQGLGLSLLRFVMRLAVQMAEDLGCIGVVVDAKPGAVGFYAQFGFLPMEVLEGQSAERPQPMAMFLAVQEIEEALD